MAEIVNVTYTASDGTVIPFQAEPFTRIKTANYHNWSFDPQTIDRRYGVRVLRFGKQAAAYQARLYFGGSISERKSRIDAFHTEIERDVRNNRAGRLTWGGYYIECFIRSSSTYPEGYYTANDIEVYAPYPFWIEPAEYHFFPKDDTEETYPWLDYSYGYDYDYTPNTDGISYVMSNAPSDSQFRLIFFGAAVDPYVYIGGTRYGMNTTLSAGEYIVIDSLASTVLRHTSSGAVLNAFNDRDKTGESIFTPIPAGRSDIFWSGNFGIDLIIYQERSEPAWT